MKKTPKPPHVMTPEQKRFARILTRMEHDAMVLYRKYRRLGNATTTSGYIITSTAGRFREDAMKFKTQREMLARNGWVGQI